MKRRSVGRPREFRTRVKRTVLLERAEARAIERAAAKAGVSVAAWLRRAAVSLLRDTQGRTKA
jgi:hypothetical protein